MNAKFLHRMRESKSYSEQIIEICFDSGSIEKMSPGLKMLYGSNDPPMFVTIVQSEKEKKIRDRIRSM